MMKFIISVVCVLMIGSAGFAQKMLEKPIDEWSQKDAMSILNDSAWAKTYQSIQGAAAASQSQALRDQSDNRLVGAERGRSERTGAPPPIIMRLHSGLPIRMALTRLNQIGAKYDKMGEEDKAKFNESAKGLLECTICQGYYVVTVTQFPNATGQSVEEAIFQGISPEQMKGNVWLKNDKGETRELAQFVPPQKRGDSAVFFFSRKNDKGDLFLTKESSDLHFVFNPTYFTNTNRYSYLLPRQFDFKVSKITVGDTVVF